MRVLKFDKNYPKLRNKVFTTVRDHDKKYVIDEIVRIESPNFLAQARVVMIEHTSLNKIPIFRLLEDLGIKDTTIRNADEVVLKEFRKIYEHINWDDEVYYYKLVKV